MVCFLFFGFPFLVYPILYMLSFLVCGMSGAGFSRGEKNKKLMLNEGTLNETICFLAERMLVEEDEKP